MSTGSPLPTALLEILIIAVDSTLNGNKILNRLHSTVKRHDKVLECCEKQAENI